MTIMPRSTQYLQDPSLGVEMLALACADPATFFAELKRRKVYRVAAAD